MPADKYETLGPLMNSIGQEVANTVGHNGEGAYLYVEIGEGWVSPSVFRDEGNQVRYFDSEDAELCDLLFEAWYTEEPDKRWASMEYVINDGKFDTLFKFPEEIDREESGDERRQRVLHARYGDKPVVYPPWSGDAYELKPGSIP